MFQIDAVGDAGLFHREVGRDHAAVGPEHLDAGLDVGPPEFGELLGGGGRLGLAEVEVAQAHQQAAHLDRHVRAAGQFLHAGQPVRMHLLVLACIRAEAQRAGGVDHDDVGIRMGARERDHVGQLRMEDAGVERQAHLRDNCAKPRRKSGVEEQLALAGAHRPGDDGIGVPLGALADAAQAAIRGLAVGFQRFRSRPGPASGRHRRRCRRPRAPGCTCRWRPWRPCRRRTRSRRPASGAPVRSARYIALHSTKTVASMLWPGLGGIAGKLLDEVAVAALVVPEMQVRIDDGQVRLERGFGSPRGQPLLVGPLGFAEDGSRVSAWSWQCSSGIRRVQVLCRRPFRQFPVRCGCGRVLPKDTCLPAADADGAPRAGSDAK